MKIYYCTDMTKLPDNCLECDMVHCGLPGIKNVTKAYRKKRHKRCPLATAEQVAREGREEELGEHEGD